MTTSSFDDREAEVEQDHASGLLDDAEYQDAMDNISDERNEADSEAEANSLLEELREESSADDFENDEG